VDKDQLRASFIAWLLNAVPIRFICSSGHNFNRLKTPTTLADATYQRVFGLTYTRVAMCFNVFYNL
jgi:hypothetical protein